VRFIPVNADTFVALSAETALIVRDGQLVFAQNDAEIRCARLG
jgi:hypothetical protein